MRAVLAFLSSTLVVAGGADATLEMGACTLIQGQGTNVITSPNCDLGVTLADGSIATMKSLAADMQYVMNHVGILPPMTPPPPPSPSPPSPPPYMQLYVNGLLEYTTGYPARYQLLADTVIGDTSAAQAYVDTIKITTPVGELANGWQVFINGLVCQEQGLEFTFTAPGDNTEGDVAKWPVKCGMPPTTPCIIGMYDHVNGWIGTANYLTVPCTTNLNTQNLNAAAAAYKISYTASSNCVHAGRGVDKLSDGDRSEAGSYRSGTGTYPNICATSTYPNMGNDDVNGINIDLNFGKWCTVWAILLANGHHGDASAGHQPDEVQVTYGNVSAAANNGGVYSLDLTTHGGMPGFTTMRLNGEHSGNIFRVQVTTAGASNDVYGGKVHGWTIEELEVWGTCE